MQKIYRPASIEHILQTVRSLLDVNSYDSFETYLNHLEQEQALHKVDVASASEWNPDNPPIWSHQRQMERAEKRHERMLKKLKMYQR